VSIVLVGLVVGVLVSAPATGPVDLLVVRHLLAGEAGRGLRIALGSALADLPYVALGALGYGWAVARSAWAAGGLDLVAAALLVGVAVHALRAPAEPSPAADDDHLGEVATGLVLGLLNGTRLVTWTMVASVVAGALPPLDLAELGLYALAVAAGELLWFGALAVAVGRLAPVSSRGFRWWTARATAALAFALAAGLVWRTVRALGPALLAG
jgi:threonine/homoserine/homoserine lactone efflux protein